MEKILLAEDRAIAVKAMQILIETEFKQYELSIAGNTDRLEEKLMDQPYRLAIINPRVMANNYTQSLLKIKNLYPALDIIVLSPQSNKMFVHYLHQNGFKGHLPEDSPDSEIVLALNKVLEGSSYFSDDPISNFLFKKYDQPAMQ